MRLFSYYGSSYDFPLLIRDHPFMCAGLTGIAKASFVVNDFFFLFIKFCKAGGRVFCELMTYFGLPISGKLGSQFWDSMR